MSIFKKFSISLILLFFYINANAEEVKMYLDKKPSAEEMGAFLFSSPQQSSDIKMRSINFVSHKQNPALGLPIKFGFDSAQILVESISLVDEIGRMLNLPSFANNKLVIEGHTDARGSEEYNRSLSERRANAVKRYLMENYNIDANKLFVTGLGESQPLSGMAPVSSMNRRVQFRKAP